MRERKGRERERKREGRGSGVGEIEKERGRKKEWRRGRKGGRERGGRKREKERDFTDNASPGEVGTHPYRHTHFVSLQLSLELKRTQVFHPFPPPSPPTFPLPSKTHSYLDKHRSTSTMAPCSRRINDKIAYNPIYSH